MSETFIKRSERKACGPPSMTFFRIWASSVDDFDLEVSFRPSGTPDAFHLPTCPMGTGGPGTRPQSLRPMGIWIRLRRSHECDRSVRPLCPWHLDEPSNRITSASQQPRVAHEPSKVAIRTQHPHCLLPRSPRCNCLRHTPPPREATTIGTERPSSYACYRFSVSPTHHLG